MKIKALERISIVLLCVILTLGTTIFTTVSVNADLSFWLSSSNVIGTWGDTQIKYGHKKLNNSSRFYFYSSGLHAIKQWEDALDISIENVLLMSEANIKVYGGTFDELTAFGFNCSNRDALGFMPSHKVTPIRVEILNEKVITVYQFEEAVVAIVDKGFLSDYNSVTTHELGHALGWLGHSSEKSDIMYAYRNGVTRVSPRDREHLLQVY